MVGFDEMSEFVHDDVVDDEHRRLDETPVEIDAVGHRARTPTVAVIDNPGRRERYAKLLRVLSSARQDFAFACSMYHSRSTARRFA
jgi:hypothetical protein